MRPTAGLGALLLLSSVVIGAAPQGTITGLSVSEATVTVGRPITATATGTAAPCGAVHIDWGDGEAITYATERLPVTQPHIYKTAGTFQLRAQGMGNCLGEARTQIVVTAPPPPKPPPAPAPPPAPRLTALALAQPRVAPRTAATITLEGSNPCAVRLDFGDGNSQEIRTLPATVRHTYALAGTYTIVATPQPPCSERRTATLHVGTEPSVRLTALEVTRPADAPASMRDLKVAGSGRCAYTLDFGDGNAEDREGTLPDVIRHNYPAEGRYTAVVTGRGACEGTQRSTFVVGRGDRGDALQGSIVRVDVRPQVARIGDALTFTVAGTGTCRFSVDFGDGASRTFTASLPHQVTYRYRRAGNFEIIVSTDPPCTGGGDAVLQIRRR